MGTFKLYVDGALTTLLSAPLWAKQLVDGSSQGVDFTVFLGSNTIGNKIQAYSNPGVDQIQMLIKHAVSLFTASQALTVGDRRRPTTPNGYIYKVTIAGTTGTEPTWPTTIGNTAVSGTVTFQCEKKEHAISEVKLAATQLGLDSATGGVPLNLGTVVNAGVANAKTIWVRVEDATLQLETNTDLYLETNSLEETFV